MITQNEGEHLKKFDVVVNGRELAGKKGCWC